MEITIEHNITDDKLEETLEKALRGLRGLNKPQREFRDKYLKHIKAKTDIIFQDQLGKMMARIEKVIK